VSGDAEYLRHLFEQAQDIIYRCDAHGCFTAFNPTAVRLMEYRADELIGRPYLSLIRPDWRRRVHVFYERQFRKREAGTYFEFAAATRSGRTVWLGQHVTLVVEDGKISGFQAIARDITARRVAEEKLQQSEARYRSLVHGAGYGIYRSNEAGDLLDVNPAFARMLGYDSAEEALALKATDLYTDPAQRARLISEIGGSRTGRLENAEVEWRRKDGSTIFVRLSGRIVPPGDPGVSAGASANTDGSAEYEVIVEDVSRRRVFEDQLRQAQKIEAVGQLAGGIAHNFNNLLMAVLGYTELLLLRHSDDADREDLEEVRKAAERGAVLTRQLLAFSRKHAPMPRDVDIARKVIELKGMMGGLVRENITLQSEAPPDPVVVRIDPAEFEEAVINLVVNARDAMPSGGTIRLAVDRVTASEMPGVPVEPGRYVRLRVEDTGAGMAPEVKAHLFEPFFTTKEQGKGIGLGLATVYGIVRQCRGAITVESEPGQGSTFALYFPEAGAAGTEPPAQLAGGGPARW
jgi:two-component system cell cycle sensor histidine kinase/response regulator CckA